jgi:hypothetical protein
MYSRISRGGDRLPTRAVSFGISSPSDLLRKTQYSRHGKVEEEGLKVARKQTDEQKDKKIRQSRGKKPLC